MIDNHPLQVRLIVRSERSRWNNLMERYHYLGYRGFVGVQLRHVATYRNQWIALLGWSAASLKNDHRDRWSQL